jgi:aminoglycoside phosphotransferase (APT) family kinase protein
MGAKELAVQRSLADLGYPTPAVRLSGVGHGAIAGVWSVTDFARGASPLDDLSGLAALRRAPALLRDLPRQLAETAAALHAVDPGPVTAAVRAAAPGVAWSVDEVLEQFEVTAGALDRPDLVADGQALARCRPPDRGVVTCHGDLHPFNLLVDEAGAVTVIDWTGALRADPAFDLAYTTLLLAHPPLDAPGPIRALVRAVGTRLERRFLARYRELAPAADLGSLDWYRAVHGLRILIELALLRDRRGGPVDHPYVALEAVARAAVDTFSTGRAPGSPAGRGPRSDRASASPGG